MPESLTCTTYGRTGQPKPVLYVEEIGDCHLIQADCRRAMRDLEKITSLTEASVDAIVTDPPYGLLFMGRGWDHGVPGKEFWVEALRVAKPGAHLLAFGGTRTHHRLMSAIEDAGWEIRDMIMWLYGSGYPKSRNAGKAIDKEAGAERPVIGKQRLTGNACVPTKDKGGTYGVGVGTVPPQDIEITGPATEAAERWNGWGTALKPAWEPIIVARKPLVGTVAENIQRHGTGALNIDECRVPTGGEQFHTPQGDPAKRVGPVGSDMGFSTQDPEVFRSAQAESIKRLSEMGRWPANVMHDGSQEVLERFPPTFPSTQGKPRSGRRGDILRLAYTGAEYSDSGSAARFFYCAKASREERGEGNDHVTVKPLALMRWLVTLITPDGGIVFDPFMGSGSTGVAAVALGRRFVGIEIEAGYFRTACGRIFGAHNDMPLFHGPPARKVTRYG